MRRRLLVHGIVQGVGFRPWIYQLAQTHRLRGFVLNSGFGVTIEIEGDDNAQQRFLEDLRSKPPTLAIIDDVEEQMLPVAGLGRFEIRLSDTPGDALALVPPDIATCPECTADFHDPANRRYGYPFTNCTNCGPRYTIIRDVPYDRPFTTMAEFPMCAACEAEYHDPSNRRFHAQPNACPECGPWVELWDHQRCLAARSEAIEAVRKMLGEGAIVAIKGMGGFHLACDASNNAAVARLRERKRRNGKPFAVMVRDVEAARQLCEVSNEEAAALASVRRPIVILNRMPGAVVSRHVAAGVETLGLMLPYTPLHHLLMAGAPYKALVMTSGNLSEEPIASCNEEIAPRLHPLADAVLLHNRKIQTRADDSVVRVMEGRERVLRRSRGYAPLPVDLGVGVEQILAYGGELKNTFCLTRGHYALLSQHIGDLENLETVDVFQQTLEHMKRFFRVKPRAVAFDLHPGYLSTRMALAESAVEQIGVQHHHAHIAACMAENRLRGTVIGVAMDGTGYGTDGKIWGGEVLVCGYADFERRAHFRYVPLAGGDAAVRQPWRSALAWVREAGLAMPASLGSVSARQMKVVEGMIAGGVNTIETSSCGRLFDAASALLGVCLETTYEGQAAIELEAVAACGVEDAYPYKIHDGEIDFRSTMRALLTDGGNTALASARFHNTVAAAIVEACRLARDARSLNRVCLSGGSFQNAILLRGTSHLLRQAGFDVYLQAKVPPNDGGLSLGQAMVANERMQV